jgi:uncharacterized protein (TIGR03435 family)
MADRQIAGGLGWISSEGYDIDAKAERPTTREQLYLMLQTLLADRFNLALRRETREMPVYALVVDKAGPKLRQHESQDGWCERSGGFPKCSCIALVLVPVDSGWPLGYRQDRADGQL